MSPGRWRACFAALALAVSAFAILQTLVVPALPALRSDVGTSDAGITWLITAFLISAAVATPILFTTGENNRVFSDSNIVNHRRLRALGCTQHELKVYPGYGHQDVFMGYHVARDCFPAMVDFMRRKAADAEVGERVPVGAVG